MIEKKDCKKKKIVRWGWVDVELIPFVQFTHMCVVNNFLMIESVMRRREEERRGHRKGDAK